MQRRGFLSFLGLTSGAIASGAALAMPKDANQRGIYVPLKCGNGRCNEKWELFIDLTKPILSGAPQCPRCLWSMALPEDIAQAVKQWNTERGFKTDIYTPRSRG